MYGYAVLTADDGQGAAATLRENKHITVLVTDADLNGDIDGLAITHLARKTNPTKIDVIYTARTPQRIPHAGKVSGAPMLRELYHPHQLVGVISAYGCARQRFERQSRQLRVPRLRAHEIRARSAVSDC
jgi:CheY-like chemotaxis protein